MTKEISQWVITFGGELEHWHFFVSPAPHLAQKSKDSQSFDFMPYQEKK
ncbi:hypothetical protein [Pareuzebyella sediminis]|nr:hypothetical protein [Pareuzebyella sediminis]